MALGGGLGISAKMSARSRRPRLAAARRHGANGVACAPLSSLNNHRSMSSALGGIGARGIAAALGASRLVLGES